MVCTGSNRCRKISCCRSGMNSCDHSSCRHLARQRGCMSARRRKPRHGADHFACLRASGHRSLDGAGEKGTSAAEAEADGPSEPVPVPAPAPPAPAPDEAAVGEAAGDPGPRETSPSCTRLSVSAEGSLGHVHVAWNPANSNGLMRTGMMHVRTHSRRLLLVVRRRDPHR